MGVFTVWNDHPAIQLQVCLLECGGDDDESALWQRRLQKDVFRLDVVGRHLRALEGGILLIRSSSETTRMSTVQHIHNGRPH